MGNGGQSLRLQRFPNTVGENNSGANSDNSDNCANNGYNANTVEKVNSADRANTLYINLSCHRYRFPQIEN